MPDVYKKGQPHEPKFTVTGHFLGMQPAEVIEKPDTTKQWFRGDDVAHLQAERDRCMAALREIIAKFDDESVERMYILDFLDIAEEALAPR